MLSNEQIFKCRVDLLEFTKTVFDGEFIVNQHHIDICDALERVVVGDIKRLIINLPPRYSKTEIAVVNFIAWCLGNFPDSKFMHCSYGADLATENAANAKGVLLKEAYREIFPEVQLKKDSTAKANYKTTAGGAVYAAGTDGPLTGKGAGKISSDGLFHGAIIIDDPIKPNDTDSETKRPKVNQWFNRTLKSRINNRDTPIIVIMQRLHEEDLSGFLLDGGDGEEWEHLCLPAIDENGQPLWEHKHNREELEIMRLTDPYSFAGQYMQSPSPIGGGIFKDSYWKFYTGLPVAFAQKVIFADTALKTKESSDYSVFQCWGKTREGQIYMLDQVRGKWEAPDLEVQAKAFYNKHNAGYNLVSNFLVEDKASGTGLIQSLRRQGLPINPIQRDIDKYTRAMSVVGMIEAGNVYLPENAEFLTDYLHEFSSFPNGKHDDQIDPTMDAIEHFLRNNVFTDYGAIL